MWGDHSGHIPTAQYLIILIIRAKIHDFLLAEGITLSLGMVLFPTYSDPLFCPL